MTMKLTMKFLTLVLAATFMTAPAFAQTRVDTLTPVDRTSGKVIAAEETYTVQSDGKLVVERTVLKQHDNNVSVKAMDTSNPVLVYDDIEEPLYIDTPDAPSADSTRVIYHFE